MKTSSPRSDLLQALVLKVDLSDLTPEQRERVRKMAADGQLDDQETMELVRLKTQTNIVSAPSPPKQTARRLASVLSTKNLTHSHRMKAQFWFIMGMAFTVVAVLIIVLG